MGNLSDSIVVETLRNFIGRSTNHEELMGLESEVRGLVVAMQLHRSSVIGDDGLFLASRQVTLSQAIGEELKPYRAGQLFDALSGIGCVVSDGNAASATNRLVLTSKVRRLINLAEAGTESSPEPKNPGNEKRSAPLDELIERQSERLVLRQEAVEIIRGLAAQYGGDLEKVARVLDEVDEVFNQIRSAAAQG